MPSKFLGIYLKWLTIAKFILKIVAPLKLAYFIYKNEYFGKADPVCTLKVLHKYLTLEKEYFPEVKVKYRDIEESLTLLASLINSYKITGSSYKLGQILTVLREEFLERGENDK